MSASNVGTVLAIAARKIESLQTTIFNEHAQHFLSTWISFPIIIEGPEWGLAIGGACMVPQVPGPVSTCVGSFVSSSRSHRDGRWHHRDSIAYRSHHTNNKMRTKSHHVNSNNFSMRAANTANISLNIFSFLIMFT